MASKLLRVANSLAKTLPRNKQVTGSASVICKRWSSADYKQAIVNLPETKVSELNNGFRIACEDSGGPTCTVGLFINAGSRYETEQTNGVAHFLEHMIFKGTAKRSQKALELEVENMGAHLNAYTSREQTVYYAKCLAKDVEKAVEILADITQNSELDPNKINAERSVILREMEEVERNQQEVVFDYLHSTAYQGTALGRTILGPSENIESLQQADLKNYINSHYTGDRMVLAGAGGVDPQKLNALGEKYFGNLKKGAGGALSLQFPTRYTGSELKHREDKLPFAHVALAVEGAAWESVDNIALMVASTAMGSWDRSYGGGTNLLNDLARKCAQNYTCNNYMAFNTCYTDTGLWGLYYVTERPLVEDMCWIVQEEWMRLCTQVSDYELESAKRQLKTNLLLQLDSTTTVCEDIGRQMLCYDRRIPIAEMDQRIDSLSSNAIRETCYEYIYDKCPVIAAIGPVEGLPEYNRLRSSTYWARF